MVHCWSIFERDPYSGNSELKHSWSLLEENEVVHLVPLLHCWYRLEQTDALDNFALQHVWSMLEQHTYDFELGEALTLVESELDAETAAKVDYSLIPADTVESDDDESQLVVSHVSIRSSPMMSIPVYDTEPELPTIKSVEAFWRMTKALPNSAQSTEPAVKAQRPAPKSNHPR